MEYIDIITTILIILMVYFVIWNIMFMFVLYKVYSNENINKIFAFIPIINYYHICELFDISYVLIFIPIINIYVIYTLPIDISDRYSVNTITKLLSVLIPIVLLPFIKTKEDIKRTSSFLRTVEDVDKIEEHLNQINDENYDERKSVQEKPIDDSFDSSIDQRIEQIETNAIQDDYYDELINMESIQDNKKEVKEEVNDADIIIDTYEVQDLFDSNDIRTNSIEQIENKIEQAGHLNIVDNAEYKDMKQEEKNVSTIAFGGIDQDERVEKAFIGDKDESLICPKCKSKVSSQAATCPTCGENLNNITQK